MLYDMVCNQRATWYNSGEITRVVQTIISLLSEAHTCTPPLRPSEIGVVAPWREQVWKLREKLREEKLSAVDVGSVEVRLRLFEIPAIELPLLYLTRTIKVEKTE